MSSPERDLYAYRTAFAVFHTYQPARAAQALQLSPLPLFTEALRCFKQKLDLDRLEWKDDAATFGTIENARI